MTGQEKSADHISRRDVGLFSGPFFTASGYGLQRFGTLKSYFFADPREMDKDSRLPSRMS
jgi:hypothetical protein